MTHCSIQNVIKYLLVSIVLSSVVVGCKGGSLPDPNDTQAGKAVSGDILLRNVNEVIGMLDQRMAKGEITKAQRDEIIEREVKAMLKDVKPESVPIAQAWQYGDAYRLANDWKTAQSLYETAIKNAKTEDRRVNDTLRLARVQAHFGKVEEAISTSRSTFNVEPSQKAPILFAVLYEIVPEVVDKSKEAELADLIVDAIGQHEQVVVDIKKQPGRDFVKSRPIHIHNAWLKAAQLYQSAGKVEKAREAIEKEEKAKSSQAAL